MSAAPSGPDAAPQLHPPVVPGVLPLRRPRALVWSAALLVAAVALPAVSHAAGLPVRWLAPMHWPVLLAGLVFGWRGGGLVGALAPAMAHAASGFPLTAVLPAMTLELAAYGLVAGLLRERPRTSGFVAVAGAVVVGRLVFVAVAWATGVETPFGPYLAAALLPGLLAAAAQVALLPLLARAWARRLS